MCANEVQFSPESISDDLLDFELEERQKRRRALMRLVDKLDTEIIGLKEEKRRREEEDRNRKRNRI